MENSVELAIHKLAVDMPRDVARRILLEFFKDRTVEILSHLDEQGVGEVINYDNLKIGGTT